MLLVKHPAAELGGILEHFDKIEIEKMAVREWMGLADLLSIQPLGFYIPSHPLPLSPACR
jgi:hypothetical protein